jgi:hypothetical protein
MCNKHGKLSRVLLTGLAITGMSTCITGCSSLKTEISEAVSSNKDIKLSVNAETGTSQKAAVDWVELDQLKTYKNLRNTWDDKFQIVNFDVSSKNGVLYVDTEGNWSSNNTLYNVFRNKVFVQDYWNDNKLKSALAQAAEDVHSDITNETTGILASVNDYFNIMPANEDGTSGLTTYLSRAEAMSAIYRCDTPVIYEESDSSFESAVGLNDYNTYAQGVLSDSYLQTDNGGLNYTTYNSAITRGEVIYMLMHRYFPDELESASTSNSSLNCRNAGNIAEKLGISGGHAYQAYELEYCLQNSDKGAPETIYKALSLASSLGIISSDEAWNDPIMGGTLLNFVIKTYQAINSKSGYLVNAKTGTNAGQSLYVVETTEPEITSTDLGTVTIEQVRDVTNLDDLFNIYGDEINMTDAEIAELYAGIDGYTFEPVDKWMEVDFCYYLNVRTGPSTDYRILRSVAKGTKAHIVARCVETGWYRIIAEGKVVYQCGVYFSDFEGSEEYLMRTGDQANDNSNLTNKNKTTTETETETDLTDSDEVETSTEDSTELTEASTDSVEAETSTEESEKTSK